MQEIRLVTRATADGAMDTTRVADELMDGANQLGRAIARFRVYRVDSGELASNLESRHQELRLSLKALMDLTSVAMSAGPAAQLAAKQVLRDLQDIADSAGQELTGGVPDGEGEPGEAG
jgi:uncharacterized protein with von Willebrand factor type A (vWA) domain